MKAIVCELCGSNDLKKEGEVFVCQHCGTKYGAEEAKKLLVEVSGSVTVENPVQVQGVVTADSLAQRAENLVKEGSYDEAIDCAKRALEADPDNEKAKKATKDAKQGKNDKIAVAFFAVIVVLAVFQFIGCVSG